MGRKKFTADALLRMTDELDLILDLLPLPDRVRLGATCTALRSGVAHYHTRNLDRSCMLQHHGGLEIAVDMVRRIDAASRVKRQQVAARLGDHWKQSGIHVIAGYSDIRLRSQAQQLYENNSKKFRNKMWNGDFLDFPMLFLAVTWTKGMVLLELDGVVFERKARARPDAPWIMRGGVTAIVQYDARYMRWGMAFAQRALTSATWMRRAFPEAPLMLDDMTAYTFRYRLADAPAAVKCKLAETFVNASFAGV